MVLFLYLVATHNPNWYIWSFDHCSDMPLPASTLWNSQWHMVDIFWGSARHHFMAFTHLQDSKWHLRRLQAFPMPPLQLSPHLLSDFTPHQQSLLLKVAKLLQVKWEYLDLYLWSSTLSVNFSSLLMEDEMIYKHFGSYRFLRSIWTTLLSAFGSWLDQGDIKTKWNHRWTCNFVLSQKVLLG